MDNKKFLCEIYPYNPSTNTFEIPVSIQKYEDFFASIDPSPASKRDLSIELVNYLGQCSDEIPRQYRVSLNLQIRVFLQDIGREQDCLDSFKTFFQHKVLIEKSEIQRRRLVAIKYLLVSFLCLSIYIVTKYANINSFFLDLLREAVLIGGWLFLWESVSIFFIEVDHHYQAIQKSARLIQAPIKFTYSQDIT
jgi:hypothetical protein